MAFLTWDGVSLQRSVTTKKTPETYWFQELRGFDPKVSKKNID